MSARGAVVKRKPKIRTDVPTLWLDEETDTLRIIWPEGSVKRLSSISGKWRPSILTSFEVQSEFYYCGPLFISKENEP